MAYHDLKRHSFFLGKVPEWIKMKVNFYLFFQKLNYELYLGLKRHGSKDVLTSIREHVLENTVYFCLDLRATANSGGFPTERRSQNLAMVAEYKVWQIQSNTVTWPNLSFQQHFAILKNGINCMSQSIFMISFKTHK